MVCDSGGKSIYSLCTWILNEHSLKEAKHS